MVPKPQECDLSGLPIQEVHEVTEDDRPIPIFLLHQDQRGTHDWAYVHTEVRGVTDRSGVFHPILALSETWKDICMGVQARTERSYAVFKVQREVCPLAVYISQVNGYWAEDASQDDGSNGAEWTHEVVRFEAPSADEPAIIEERRSAN